MTEVICLSLVFMIPSIIIGIVAWLYLRAYTQKGEAVTRDPQTAWNALKSGITALLEILAVISIGTMVFILSWHKIMSSELAAAFYSGLIGYFIGSARARASQVETKEHEASR